MLRYTIECKKLCLNTGPWLAILCSVALSSCQQPLDSITEVTTGQEVHREQVTPEELNAVKNAADPYYGIEEQEGDQTVIIYDVDGNPIVDFEPSQDVNLGDHVNIESGGDTQYVSP